MMKEYYLNSEQEIWDAFRAGEEQAYEVMFKRYYLVLLSYGQRINHDKEEVKDCIQHLFTRLWESRSRLGKNDSIRNYLIASLRRIVLRRARKKPIYADINTIQTLASLENVYLTRQRALELEQFLVHLMQKLPNRQKEVITLKYFEEHNFSEIAGIMGISTRVVYKLIYKALTNLSLQAHDRKALAYSLMR